MLAFTVAVGAFAVLSGILSRALLVDVVSFWPGAVAAAASLPVVWAVRNRSHRVRAVPPLILLTWIVLGSAAHLSGWALLPSSAAELIGPPAVAGPVEFAAQVDGRMVVTAGEGPSLYRVRFLRRGGTVGVPVAEEFGDPLQVMVGEEPGGTWFRFAGWVVELSAAPRWDLRFDPGGGRADVDLRGVDVNSIALAGRGTLELGADGSGTVQVAGTYTVSVPRDTPVRLEGAGTVPDGWIPTPEGWRSPAEGPGWLIVVADGGAVAISTP